jgi:MFS transporter, Spinster family, sphingosine-1-phosphate transporter
MPSIVRGDMSVIGSGWLLTACSVPRRQVDSLVALLLPSIDSKRPFVTASQREGKRMGLSPRYAWFVLALLILLNVVNFVDRQLVVSLQVPLKADPYLGLDDLKITLLAGYAFAVVYSIAGLFLGTIADRWNRPRLIAAGLLVWSAMTAASGLAQSFWQLAAARVFVAVGEATLTPAAVAMLGDAFPPRQRSLASGLYYLGIPLGAGLSLIIAGVLEPIPSIGWRGCYQILGLVGLLLVAVVALVKDPRDVMASAATEAPQPKATPRTSRQLAEMFHALWLSPALVMTMIGAIAINIGVGTTWLEPSWLVTERGFDKSEATMFLGLNLLLGGSLGNLLGGWLGDLFHRRTSGGRLLALVCLQLVIAPAGILFRFGPANSIAFPLSCLMASIYVTMMYGPVLATVQELTPPRIRSTMLAFLIIWLNVLGASLGAVIAARLTKHLGSYTWGIFLTAQLGLIAVPLFLLAARRYETDRKRLQLYAAEVLP